MLIIAAESIQISGDVALEIANLGTGSSGRKA